MRLSDLASKDRWLWHVIRSQDLPVVTADGIVPLTGDTFLVETRKAAFPGDGRTVLRIDRRAINVKRLHRVPEWSAWVSGRVEDLPQALIRYWQRVALVGEDTSRRALRTQLARVETLWRYDGIIKAEAIAALDRCGLYLRLKGYQL
jgi:hypothetical protein